MKKFLVAAALVLLATPALADTPFSPNNGIQLGRGTKTATATAGAATLHKLAGVITTESLTTAGVANYTLTVTNNTVVATDQVFASVTNGTNSVGNPGVLQVKAAAGSLQVVIRNFDPTVALSGTLKVSFVVIKN